MQNAQHHSKLSDPDDMEHERGPSGLPNNKNTPLVDENIGDVFAGQRTKSQTAGSGFSLVRISKGMNKNESWWEGTTMAMPTTVDATMTAAKEEYAAATMEHESAKLRLE